MSTTRTAATGLAAAKGERGTGVSILPRSPHETIRKTPAMALGLTDHPWSIAKLIDAVLRGLPEEPSGWQGRFRVIDGGRA
jgi:hypothetical protein